MSSAFQSHTGEPVVRRPRPADALRHQRRARPASTSTSDPGEVVCLLGPNGAGKTTTIEILEGFRMRVGRRGAGARRRPGAGDEAWRARVGVVLQSWRDHARWTPRELLEPPRRLLRPVLHAGAPPALRRGRADRHRRARRARRPEDRHALRRPAAPARRGDRHRRPPRAAVPRRAHGRLRPAGAPRLPRPGAPAVRPGGHDDPAHHPRPRRGREAGRPHPDPRRRPDRRRRQRRRAGPAGRRPSPRCAGRRDGERFVHATDDATAFVRELFEQHGEAIADLEVRRASLEDTYIAMVQRARVRRAGAAVGASRRRPDEPDAVRRARSACAAGWTEFVQSLRSAAGPVGSTCSSAWSRWSSCSSTRNAEVERHRRCSLAALALPSILGVLLAFGGSSAPAYALAMEREDGTLLRAKALPHGHASATSPGSCSCQSLGLLPHAAASSSCRASCSSTA